MYSRNELNDSIHFTMEWYWFHSIWIEEWWSDVRIVGLLWNRMDSKSEYESNDIILKSLCVSFMKHYTNLIIWISYLINELVLSYYQMVSSICYDKLHSTFLWYSIIWIMTISFHFFDSLYINLLLSQSSWLDCNHDNPIWLICDRIIIYC